MLDTQSTKAVEKMIASSLRGRDPIQVIYAALALRNWMDLPDSASSPEFRKLASMVIGIIECGRTIAQQQLLRLARELLTGDRLSDDQCMTPSEIVPDIFGAADYNNSNQTARKPSPLQLSGQNSSVRLNIEQIHLVSVLRLIGACRIEPQGA